MLLITISTLCSPRVHVLPLRSTMRRACPSSIALMNTVLLLVNVTVNMLSFVFIIFNLSLSIRIVYAINANKSSDILRKLFTMRTSLNKRGTGPAACQAKSLDPPGGYPGVPPRGSVLIITLCLKRRFSDALNNNLNELPNHHTSNKCDNSDDSHE